MSNHQTFFSTSFNAGKRSYFFDIKETSVGDKYIKITESELKDRGEFKQHEILIFPEDFEKFSKAIAQTFGKYNEGNSNLVENQRKKYENAYMPWTAEDDNRLELLFCEGKKNKDLAKVLGRNPGAISSRIRKLELKEKYAQ